jgi:uncharacterized HAD superfamily protein
MIYEMMIQTHTSYNDILNMTVSEMNDFFEYRSEQVTGRAKLTEQQQQMIEDNKEYRKKMGWK